MLRNYLFSMFTERFNYLSIFVPSDKKNFHENRDVATQRVISHTDATTNSPTLTYHRLRKIKVLRKNVVKLRLTALLSQLKAFKTLQ